MAEIITLRGELQSADPARISIRSVNDQRVQWLELQTEFQAWAATVRERFQTLQGERERLRDVRERWELTAREPDPEATLVAVSSELNVAINRELKEAGITIPFPQRDLHLKSTAAATDEEESAVIEAFDRSD